MMLKDRDSLHREPLLAKQGPLVCALPGAAIEIVLAFKTPPAPSPSWPSYGTFPDATSQSC